MSEQVSTHYDGGNVMYMRRCRTLAALDRFGLALANQSLQWTHRERREFEKRVRELKTKNEQS